MPHRDRGAIERGNRRSLGCVMWVRAATIALHLWLELRARVTQERDDCVRVELMSD